MTDAFNPTFLQDGSFRIHLNPSPCPFAGCGGVGRPAAMDTDEAMKAWGIAMGEISAELARRGLFNQVVEEVQRMVAEGASPDELAQALSAVPQLAAVLSWIRTK